MEKPAAELTQSRLASVVFYCFQKKTLPTLTQFLNLQAGVEDRVLGKYLVRISVLSLFFLKYLPTPRLLLQRT